MAESLLEVYASICEVELMKSEFKPYSSILQNRLSA